MINHLVKVSLPSIQTEYELNVFSHLKKLVFPTCIFYT